MRGGASLFALILIGFVGLGVCVGAAPAASPPPQSATGRPAAPAELARTARAQFDTAVAALEAAKATALRNFEDDSAYRAAKADLENKTAARNRARSEAPQKRIEADSAVNLARRKVEQMLSDAVTQNPAVTAASARVEIARRALALVMANQETEQDRRARIEARIMRLSTAQLLLAQRLADGGVPELPADQLKVGAVGRLVLPAQTAPARHDVPAAVVQVVSKTDVLILMLDQWVWLSQCPTDGMKPSQRIPVNGTYTVSDVRTVQVGSVQRTVPVLEPANLDELKEIAAFLQSPEADQDPAGATAPSASANPPAEQAKPPLPGVRRRTFTSIAQIYRAVPYQLQVESAEQATGLRGQLRSKWLSENIPGAVLNTVVRFDDADIQGGFAGSDTFRDVAGERTATVKAHFTDAQALALSRVARGEQLYIRGTIVRAGDGAIELADFSFRRPVKTSVDLGGGTIPVGTGASRHSR